MKTRVVDTHAAEQQGQLHRAREEQRSESETHRDGGGMGEAGLRMMGGEDGSEGTGSQAQRESEKGKDALTWTYIHKCRGRQS